MDYQKTRAYALNEITGEYEESYIITHKDAIYTEDDESKTLGDLLNEFSNKIGDLSTLTTTNKSSLVNAIIEAIAQISNVNDELQKILNGSDLTTELGTTIVTANSTKNVLDTSISTAQELIDELLDTNSEINQHINNEDIHVTKTNKDNWDTNVLNTNNHIANNEIHVNKDDKDSWNRIDEVIHLIDILASGSGLVDENSNNITIEDGSILTM